MQFDDLVEFSEDMANAGKIVIVAALDSTYQKKPFGRVTDLVSVSECVTKLSAVCKRCKKDAAFSYRLSTEKQVEVIGGEDKYVALCRSCYMRSSRDGSISDYFAPLPPGGAPGGK